MFQPLYKYDSEPAKIRFSDFRIGRNGDLTHKATLIVQMPSILNIEKMKRQCLASVAFHPLRITRLAQNHQMTEYEYLDLLC